MPKVSIFGKEIFYEVYGQGEAVVFLNGIMMSTLSWKPFLPVFTNYKMVLVDLIDQGGSDKAEDAYTQDYHVEMLKELIYALKLGKVHLLGISYGGEVAMKFALKHQNMLHSLILSNTTSETSNHMKDIEEAWDFAASTYDGKIFFKITMPYIYSAKFYYENSAWLKEREKVLSTALTKEWYEGFRRALRSASSLNITNELENIKIPVLIIGSDLDIMTPLRNQEEMYKRIPGCRMVIIKDAGHASMYERPHEFAVCILGFMSILNKEIKIV